MFRKEAVPSRSDTTRPEATARAPLRASRSGPAHTHASRRGSTVGRRAALTEDEDERVPESAAVLPAREALSADLVGGGRSDGGRPGFPCGLRAAAARRCGRWRWRGSWWWRCWPSSAASRAHRTGPCSAQPGEATSAWPKLSTKRVTTISSRCSGN